MKTKRQFDLYRAVLSLKKQWPLCLTVFFSVLLIGLIATIKAEKVYKTSATVTVNLDAQTEKLWPEVTQYEVMKSPSLLARIQNDQFSIHPSKDLKSVSVEAVHRNPKLAAELANKVVSVYLEYQTEKKDEAIQKQEKILDEQTKKEEKKLQLEAKRESRFLELNSDALVLDTDKEFLKAEAENLALDRENELFDLRREQEEKLIDLRQDREDKILILMHRQEEQFLESEIKEIKEDLAVFEKSLHDYMAKNHILNLQNLENKISIVKHRITLFEKELVKVQASGLNQKSKELDLKKIIFKEQENEMYLEGLITNILKFKDQIEENRKLNESKINKLKELKLKNLRLEEERKLKFQQLKEERRLKTEQIAGERKLKAEQSKKEIVLKRARSLKMQQIKVEQNVKENAKENEWKLKQLKEEKMLLVEQLKESLKKEDVFLVIPAPVPESPYLPNWKKNMILSLLFALLLSIGIVLLLEMLDQRTFKTAEQIEEELRLPFLGFSASTEIRTNLSLMSPDKPLRSLLVTASKTSMNLALSMAESGKQVLLLQTAGLPSLMVGEIQLEEAILHAKTPNLDFLGRGSLSPLWANLFQTAKFKSLFEELQTRYDLIIFDSSEPQLAAQVDGVVLAIDSGVTPRETVEEILEAFKQMQACLLGVVLQEPPMPQTWFAAILWKYYRHGKSYEPHGDVTTVG